jgi:hypothetical protein
MPAVNICNLWSHLKHGGGTLNDTHQGPENATGYCLENHTPLRAIPPVFGLLQFGCKLLLPVAKADASGETQIAAPNDIFRLAGNCFLAILRPGKCDRNAATSLSAS